MLPRPTARLRFRELQAGDLGPMAAMLGDPGVMAHYPAPKSRAEAARWIEWSRENYASYGFGLWLVETHDGRFVGDCGLTLQPVGRERMLEIGYHVSPAQQGRGYATEAGFACLALARERRLAREVVAIVHPANTASQRVAGKLGLTPWLDEDDSRAGPGRIVLRVQL